MAKIDVSQVTYNPGQIEDLSELFFEAIFLDPALEQFHTIVTGIKGRKQVVFMGRLNGLSGKKQTSCDWDENPAKMIASDKEWNPAYIGDRFSECFANLLDTFFVWLGTGLKSGVEKPDLTNTSWSAFLEAEVSLSAKDAVLRHAWFGNVAAENVADGGVIKNGVDIDYFNAIDGFWIQLVQIALAKPKQKVTIARNGGANYAAQEFDDSDITNGTVTKIFQKMLFRSADMRLRGQVDKAFIVTQSMCDQYALEREAVTNIPQAYERIETGIDQLRYQNIPVIPFEFLDRTIRTYEDTGVKYNNPHRAALLSKGNTLIGVENTSDLTELDPFYDKKSKNYYVDYAFNLDAQIPFDYLCVVAF